MATTTISDYVIWAKHIHDDPDLAARVAAMRAGETIDLEVDGIRGAWRKMDNGKDGRPTPGLRPIGSTQEVWRDLYKQRRGGTVRLTAPVNSGQVSSGRTTPGFSEGASPMFRNDLATFLRTDAERQAALAALLDGARQGWRSEGRMMSRDDMHER